MTHPRGGVPPHTSRARAGFPWRGLFASLSLTALLWLGLALRTTLDPIARQEAGAAAVRRGEIADAVQPVAILSAALWHLIPPVMLIAIATTALLIAWRRWGWRESIAARHLVDAERARAGQLAGLRTLTYSPRITGPAPARLPGDTAAALAEDGEASPVPTFAELLDAGTIGQAGPGGQPRLVLGYHAGEAITGGWQDLYSSGIGGLQGSGKTWTACCLLAQSALAGARIVICDPHAGDSESLTARCAPLAPALLCEPATGDRAILKALRLASGHLHRRRCGLPDRTPLVVAVDEWTSLRRGPLADLLPGLVEAFSTEGRKLNCHVLLLGQRWEKEAVGNMRNTLASAYVHRMRPDEARMLTGLKAARLPADTLELSPGRAYLLDTRGQFIRVSIPHTTPADIATVGAMLGGRLSVPRQNGTGQAPGNHPARNGKAGAESPETAPGSAITGAPDTAHIVRLFQAGRGVREIVLQLWPDEGSGRNYNARRDYVETVIREAARSMPKENPQ